MWMYLRNMMLNENIYKRSHSVLFQLYEILKTDKSIDTECKLGEGRTGKKLFNGSWSDGMFWKYVLEYLYIKSKVYYVLILV